MSDELWDQRKYLPQDLGFGFGYDVLAVTLGEGHGWSGSRTPVVVSDQSAWTGRRPGRKARRRLLCNREDLNDTQFSTIWK